MNDRSRPESLPNPIAVTERPLDGSLAKPPRTEPILRLSDVTLEYRQQGRRLAAVTGLNLAVADGERVAIVGPSGCGKSTLLAAVAGLLQPSVGQLEVSGEVALMPQHDLLVPWRSALRNAALALEAQGVPRAKATAAAEPLFERFGLASFEQAMPWQLSGGMRQRVAFLRTVLTGRPILALDEPFGALDSITRGEMHEWLSDALRAEPRTVLLVTHDVDEALTLAERIVVLADRPGHVIDQLEVRRPTDSTRREWITSPEFSRLKNAALEALS